MVAARIVHGEGRRMSPGGGRVSKIGRGQRGGAPPQLPPPIPEALSDNARVGHGRGQRGKRGIARGGAVVAVDLLDMKELPGVKVRRNGGHWRANRAKGGDLIDEI